MSTHQPDKRPLQRMFMSVPPSYDMVNRLLTLGLDQFWRKRAAIACLEGNPLKVLDLCTGTGDLVLKLGSLSSEDTELTALDYSVPMIDLAMKKAAGKGLEKINFLHGDAADMPFEDNFFDSVGIAFAFRNLTFHNPDRERFLSEILRVLKPGGRFVVIETSQPENILVRKFFHFYMSYVTVPLATILSGQRGAYKYLAHSARNYYNRFELESILIGAGFSTAESELFLGGVAGLFIAVK